IALRDFLAAKKFDVTQDTHRQLTFVVGRFVDFLSKKSKVKTAEAIAREHISAYRETLLHFSDSNHRKHIVLMKQFLRDIEREDLARKIRNPKLTPEGNVRRKPRPFSDAEIEVFLKIAAPRVGLFFRTAISTGLAVIDMIRLNLDNLQKTTDGC